MYIISASHYSFKLNQGSSRQRQVMKGLSDYIQSTCIWRLTRHGMNSIRTAVGYCCNVKKLGLFLTSFIDLNSDRDEVSVPFRVLILRILAHYWSVTRGHWYKAFQVRGICSQIHQFGVHGSLRIQTRAGRQRSRSTPSMILLITSIS